MAFVFHGLSLESRKLALDAVRRYVAEVNIKSMLPQHFSGIGIEAHQALLLRLAAARSVLQIDMAVHHDRG